MLENVRSATIGRVRRMVQRPKKEVRSAFCVTWMDWSKIGPPEPAENLRCFGKEEEAETFRDGMRGDPGIQVIELFESEINPGVQVPRRYRRRM